MAEPRWNKCLWIPDFPIENSLLRFFPLSLLVLIFFVFIDPCNFHRNFARLSPFFCCLVRVPKESMARWASKPKGNLIHCLLVNASGKYLIVNVVVISPLIVVTFFFCQNNTWVECLSLNLLYQASISASLFQLFEKFKRRKLILWKLIFYLEMKQIEINYKDDSIC